MKRIISTLIVAAVAALSSADAFAGSRVIIDQYGSFNGVGAVQQGNNNFIRLYQKHRQNNAIIQQYGDGNVSVSGQDGRWNSSNSLHALSSNWPRPAENRALPAVDWDTPTRGT